MCRWLQKNNNELVLKIGIGDDEIETDKTQNKQNELKAAKKRIKDLEKELNRKDKALAEMAAIMALKKKLDIVFGDHEED